MTKPGDSVNCPKCGRLSCGCSNNGQSTVYVNQTLASLGGNPVKLQDLRSNDYLLRVLMTEWDEGLRQSAYDEALARMEQRDAMDAFIRELVHAIEPFIEIAA